MLDKKYITPALALLTGLVLYGTSILDLAKYGFHSINVDSRINILDYDSEESNSYNDISKIKELEGKASLILFNNGWTKDRLIGLDHLRLFENCKKKNWNLVYLSNEFGDGEYNRSKARWFNNISEQKLYGYHIYAPESFEVWKKYIREERKDKATISSFPHALIADEGGIISDTLYDYNNKQVQQLLE